MDMELINTARIELDTLSEFQKMIHYPISTDEEIDSKFSYQFKKTTWSVNLTEKLKRNTSEKSIIFEANNKFDFDRTNTITPNQLVV